MYLSICHNDAWKSHDSCAVHSKMQHYIPVITYTDLGCQLVNLDYQHLMSKSLTSTRIVDSWVSGNYRALDLLSHARSLNISQRYTIFVIFCDRKIKDSPTTKASTCIKIYL